jgi:hypothetical protein
MGHKVPISDKGTKPMMNVNEKTGVAYGFISANSLDTEIVMDLMMGFNVDDFRNVSEDRAVAEIAESYRNRIRDNGDETDISRVEDMSADEIFDMLADSGQVSFDDLLSDEPIVEGDYLGVHYMSSWLGGALHFFIMESPVITGKAGRASPCVPGAGILDSLDGDVVAYDVPLDWRADQMVKVW